MNARMFRPLAAISLCCAVAPATMFMAKAMPATSARDDAVLTLTKLAETRVAQVVKPAGEEGVFEMSSDEPSLSLTFSLALPQGCRVMSVEQPPAVTAVDSAGTDLSKIKPGFSDELEYVDLEHDFKDDDDVCEITFKLLPTARSAATFSARASFNAVVYTGSKPVAVEGKAEWTTLTDESVAGLGKPVRFRAKDDGLEFEPSEVEDRIEEISIQTGPNEVVESNGWFSDGSTITYLFDEMPAARPLKATITLRTGVKTIPLIIDVKNQPLP